MAGRVLHSGGQLVDEDGNVLVVTSGGAPGGASFPLTNTGATAATDAMNLKVTGDSRDRFVIDHDGTIRFTNGASASEGYVQFNLSSGTYPIVNIQPRLAVDVGFSLGQYAGYTGDLAQFQLDGNPTKIGLVIRAAASQTANMQEWRDSASAVMSYVSAAGNPTVKYNKGFYGETAGGTPVTLMFVGVAGGDGNVADIVPSLGSLNYAQFGGGNLVANGSGQIGIGTGRIASMGSRLLVLPTSAASIPVVVRAAASQTANLQEWQDSAGTMLVSITPNGTIKGGGSGVSLARSNGNTVAAFAFDTASLTEGSIYTASNYNGGTGGASHYMRTSHAGNIVLNVRGVASQTASLQEWQDSTGAVLTSITAAGLRRWNTAASQQTTVGAAGGATALPATPTKYLKVVDSAGTTLVIPAYAAA